MSKMKKMQTLFKQDQHNRLDALVLIGFETKSESARLAMDLGLTMIEHKISRSAKKSGSPNLDEVLEDVKSEILIGNL